MSWICKIKHNWLYLFHAAPWREYRGCLRCRRLEESYHPAGFAPLTIRWKQIDAETLLKAFNEFKQLNSKYAAQFKAQQEILDTLKMRVPDKIEATIPGWRTVIFYDATGTPYWRSDGRPLTDPQPKD